MIINIKSEKHFEETIENSKDRLLLVKFGASWCAPCKTLDPILEQIDQEKNGQIDVLKVSVDDLPEIASEFRIMSVPTTFFILNKEAVTVLNGSGSYDTILDIINEIITHEEG